MTHYSTGKQYAVHDVWVPSSQTAYAVDETDQGITMSLHFEHSTQNHFPKPDEPSIPELEVDQTIVPRPEEEIADALRAKPDVEDHSQHRVKTPPASETK